MSKPRYAEVAGRPGTHALAVNNQHLYSWNTKMKRGRCCYKLNNGKRCSNPAVGLNIKNGMPIYTVQCKVHAPVCLKAYNKYKSICHKGFSDLKDLKKCPVGKTPNAKKIKALEECARLRMMWPRRCVYGCLDHPNSQRGKNVIKEVDKRHIYITALLLECRKKHLKCGKKNKKDPKKCKV